MVWIIKIPSDESFMDSDRLDLLLNIYKMPGDTDKVAEIAWLIFRTRRSTNSLDRLLQIIGNDKRDEVIGREVIYN